MINRRDDSDQSCWSIPYRESMTCPSQGLYFEMTDTKASLGWSRGCGGPLGGGVYHCISNEKNGGKLWWDIGEIYNDINLENGYR